MLLMFLTKARQLRKPWKNGVEFCYSNILNAETLAVIQSAEVVINCTGQITNPIESCLKLNSEGVMNLLQHIATEGYFIQLSTVGVYGEKKVAEETLALNPQTAYSTAKAMAEIIIKEHCKAKSLILRLSNLYGPGQPKGLMAYLLRSYKTDRKLEFEHSGNMVRSFLHVDDCAKIITDILANQIIPEGIFNIAGNDYYSVSDIIKQVEEIKDIKFTKHWGNCPSWEDIGQIKIDKIKELLSINLQHSIAEYIRSEF
jgi:UDP-glucose 4-epimerase